MDHSMGWGFGPNKTGESLLRPGCHVFLFPDHGHDVISSPVFWHHSLSALTYYTFKLWARITLLPLVCFQSGIVYPHNETYNLTEKMGGELRPCWEKSGHVVCRFGGKCGRFWNFEQEKPPNTVRRTLNGPFCWIIWKNSRRREIWF